MRQPFTSGSAAIVTHATAAAAQAARLRKMAVALRRLAGMIKFNPVTGERPTLTPEVDEMLSSIDEVLGDIERGSADRASDETALTLLEDTVLSQIKFAHEAIEHSARVTADAVGVLRGVLSASDGASVDAPYGHGAPRRHHPGALCTIVAERAESLAAAMENAAITKLNAAGAR